MSTKWNTANIPPQEGKTFLVTGANSGLGFGTSKALAQKGAKVVMTVRNLQKGEQALAAIKSKIPTADLVLMQLDLADLSSVERFTEAFQQRFQRLDVLINNAGVMMPNTRQLTQQGFELQFGTNHIGHFVLTRNLLPILEQTQASRIVTLSSLVAKMSKADIYWEDLQWEQSYDKMAAYAQSKLANMMFGVELHQRLKTKQSNTISVLAHPGYTATNLQNNMGIQGKIMNFLFAQKLQMGILPTLRAATDPNVKGGEYYGPERMGNFRGYPVLNELNPVALDSSLNQRLWKVSEDLIQVNFN